MFFIEILAYPNLERPYLLSYYYAFHNDLAHDVPSIEGYQMVKSELNYVNKFLRYGHLRELTPLLDPSVSAGRIRKKNSSIMYHYYSTIAWKFEDDRPKTLGGEASHKKRDTKNNNNNNVERSWERTIGLCFTHKPN